jgi:hypothetical protein
MYAMPLSSIPIRPHKWLSASYSRRVIQAVNTPDTTPMKHTGRITIGWDWDSMIDYEKTSNAGLQLRRAVSIQAEGRKLLEKHAIAPSAARLCSTSPQS